MNGGPQPARRKAPMNKPVRFNVMVIAAWLCVVGMIAFVLCGRIATFHDTEMEALVNGWEYWMLGLASGLAGYFFARR